MGRGREFDISRNGLIGCIWFGAMARPTTNKISENNIPRGRGRPKGSLNKSTADIKALAQVHAPKAMRELARLAENAESEAARVAAIKELFDRGFGKASQLIGSDPDAPLPSGLVVHFAKTGE